MGVKIGSYRVVDIINPMKWWAILDSKLAKRYTSVAYSEQLVYRMTVCPECVGAGKCQHECGCDCPENMMAKQNSCSDGLWGPMLDEKRWSAFKNSHLIRFNTF